MIDLTAKDKRRVFEELLDSGVTALHLDPRREGVEVPAWLSDQPWLVLNYSQRYGIADFHWDDEAVWASLSFSRQPHRCRVPWHAVFGITDQARQRGRIWERDAPPDLNVAQGSSAASAQQAQPSQQAAAPKAAKGSKTVTGDRTSRRGAQREDNPPAPAPRPGLRVIEGGNTAPPTPTASGHEPEPPRPRPALRRIK